MCVSVADILDQQLNLQMQQSTMLKKRIPIKNNIDTNTYTTTDKN